MHRTLNCAWKRAACGALLVSVFALCANASEPQHGKSGSSLTPDQVLTALKSSNGKYTTGKCLHQHEDADRRHETTTGGQHPIATVIACSDSRVPVEALFDQGIGDLFVIRVAGNVCDTDEIGSIEYGVDHLGTPLMIVLGHRNCGAVTAVATKAEVHGSIPALVDNIAPAVVRAVQKNPDKQGDALIAAAVQENVWQSIDDLFQFSPATRERVSSGKLKVVGAIYDIGDGHIDWLGEHPEQARLLKYTGTPHTADETRSRDAKALAAVTGHEAAPKRFEEQPSPEAALGRFALGNARYVIGRHLHPHRDRSRMQETMSKGQHPFATVITCSDSRVPVEELFDQGVGDIFVIRVAGNVCDTDEIGSIEYGVDHLGTPLMVVMGHTNCGAVTACVAKAELHGNIPPLVDNIMPIAERVCAAHPDWKRERQIKLAIEENVWNSIEELLAHSPATRARVKAGMLRVVGAIYDIDSGNVLWLGDHPDQASLLNKAEPAPAHASASPSAEGH